MPRGQLEGKLLDAINCNDCVVNLSSWDIGSTVGLASKLAAAIGGPRGAGEHSLTDTSDDFGSPDQIDHVLRPRPAKVDKRSTATSFDHVLTLELGNNGLVSAPLSHAVSSRRLYTHLQQKRIGCSRCRAPSPQRS